MATQTTHFNINKPEGTDIFAPLTFDNDAYDLIDSVMYDNQNRGITTTSISFSAGVFAIVRNVVTCNFLVFTAPADYTAGNTVEVDGQIKTVRFMDGTSLQTGAWKINYSVLAYVDGSILNIISSTTGDYASLIGDLTDLDTIDKSNVVNAINEVVSDVSGIDTRVTTLETAAVEDTYSSSYNGLTIHMSKKNKMICFELDGNLASSVTGGQVYAMDRNPDYRPEAVGQAVYIPTVGMPGYVRIDQDGTINLCPTDNYGTYGVKATMTFFAR